MQIYKSGGRRPRRRTLAETRWLPVEEGLRFLGFKTKGPTGTLRGPAAQGPRLREVLHLSNTRGGSGEPQELNQELKVPPADSLVHTASER